MQKAEHVLAVIGALTLLGIASLIWMLKRDGDRRSWLPLSDEQPRPYGMFSASTLN